MAHNLQRYRQGSSFPPPLWFRKRECLWSNGIAASGMGGIVAPPKAVRVSAYFQFNVPKVRLP